MNPDTLAQLKIMLRENDVPYFTDDDIEAYFEMAQHDINLTAYKCLIAKSEDTTLSVPGLTTGDTARYFLRLASQYRPSNSKIVRGGY